MLGYNLLVSAVFAADRSGPKVLALIAVNLGGAAAQTGKLWQVIVVTTGVLLFHGLVLLLTVGVVLLVGAVSWLCYAIWRLVFG